MIIKGKAMLSTINLATRFWADAIAIISYLTNISLIVVVRNIIPKEAWSG